MVYIESAIWLSHQKEWNCVFYLDLDRHREWIYEYQVGRGRVGGINWEIGIYIYNLLYIKITNENLLYDTGIYSMICSNLNRKGIQKGDLCIHRSDSLCCQEKLTQYCKTIICQIKLIWKTEKKEKKKTRLK